MPLTYVHPWILSAIKKTVGLLYMSIPSIYFSTTIRWAASKRKRSARSKPPLFTTFDEAPRPTPGQEDVLGLQISMPWGFFQGRQGKVQASPAPKNKHHIDSWWLNQPVFEKIWLYNYIVKLDPSSPNNFRDEGKHIFWNRQIVVYSNHNPHIIS